MHVVQAMLLPANFPAIVEPMSDSAKLGIQNIFAFSYVWSIGGAIESHSRDAFDALVRTTFQGVAIFPAGAGLVYDYYCDPQRCSHLSSSPQYCLLTPPSVSPKGAPLFLQAPNELVWWHTLSLWLADTLIVAFPQDMLSPCLAWTVQAAPYWHRQRRITGPTMQVCELFTAC